MKVKITDKNAVLKTAKTFIEEDINVEIDESLLGGSGGADEGFNFTVNINSPGGNDALFSCDGGLPQNYMSNLNFPFSGKGKTYTAFSPLGFNSQPTITGGTVTLLGLWGNTSLSNATIAYFEITEDNAVITVEIYD